MSGRSARYLPHLCVQGGEEDARGVVQMRDRRDVVLQRTALTSGHNACMARDTSHPMSGLSARYLLHLGVQGGDEEARGVLQVRDRREVVL